MYDELLKRLRNRRVCIQSGGDLEVDFPLMRDAADAIEELGSMLCNWCGVCPEDKQNVWDCEIAFPELQVPEVSIKPPTYPCADCVHYPPSSTDGKPCCACDPANPLTNCREAKEET